MGGHPEAAIGLRPEQRDQGCATRASHSSLMFAFKELGVIICSAMAEEVGSEVRTAGDRDRRRRLNKLSCAGWVPHDRGFVSGLPRSKDERRSGDRLITGREGSPPRPCRRQCAPLNLLASASFSCVRQVQQFGHGAGSSGGEPPVSVAAVATVSRSPAAPRGRDRQWPAASPPVSTLRGWPAGCRAKRGIPPAR
jgi:hypothetical protein